MPQWPHWYIVAAEGNRRREFIRFAKLIEDYGKEEFWGRRKFCYLCIGNYKYWVMDDIINRAAPIPSWEVLRRGEQWLRQHGNKNASKNRAARSKSVL